MGQRKGRTQDRDVKGEKNC